MIYTKFKYTVNCTDDKGSYILDSFDTKEEAQDLIDRRIIADNLLKLYDLCDYSYEYTIVLKVVKVNDDI